ncbi:MAG: SAM-dependent methyltransferase [Burkholderiales bacterium]
MLALAAAVAADAAAQEPRVPYVPTPQEVVDRMLGIAKVGPQDYLIDLGSGDGRIVITAARKHKTRGFGVDLNAVRIEEANENARRAGVTDRVAFYQRDLFQTDLASATVITMYLLPQVNIELRPRLLELKPGTRLVSHDFDMGDWKPDTHVTMESKEKYGGSGGTSDIYFWVVPAAAAGIWQWELPAAGKPQPYELTLEQKYQEISGSVRAGGSTAKITGARLRGEEIRLAMTGRVGGRAWHHLFRGKLAAGRIAGEVRISDGENNRTLPWTATRTR